MDALLKSFSPLDRESHLLRCIDAAFAILGEDTRPGPAGFNPSVYRRQLAGALLKLDETFTFERSADNDTDENAAIVDDGVRLMSSERLRERLMAEAQFVLQGGEVSAVRFARRSLCLLLRHSSGVDRCERWETVSFSGRVLSLLNSWTARRPRAYSRTALRAMKARMQLTLPFDVAAST